MAGRVLRRGLLTGGAAWVAARSAYADGYDPLGRIPQSAAADHVYEIEVRDAARGRAIPLRIAHGARRMRMPVVLFSHGLGGSRTGAAFLERHWRMRGYVTMFLQHPGSDDEVWRDGAPGQRLAALRAAATAEQLFHRMRDVVAVLDGMMGWLRDPELRSLGERVDLARLGLAGHSFGALTTQAVAGQMVPPVFPGTWPDPRIKAALVLSPSVPAAMPAATAFGQVGIPWMLMTGTQDGSPVGPAPDRLGVFPALPPGRKYELVLEGAEHGVFGDRPLPGEGPHHRNHHRAIQALSTAFWDSTLGGNAMAQAWLDGDAARGVLEPGDRWQRK